VYIFFSKIRPKDIWTVDCVTLSHPYHSNISQETRLTQIHASVAWSKLRHSDIFEIPARKKNMSTNSIPSSLNFWWEDMTNLLDCLTDISYKRRNIYLEDVKHSNDIPIPLVFSTDYFPQRCNAEIKQALLMNWHFVSNNHNLCKIFPCPLILALRRTQNLGERLIRAKIISNQNTVSLIPNM